MSNPNPDQGSGQAPDQQQDQESGLTSNQAHSPYVLLGGEPAVRKLVDRFYELMDETSAATVIRKMHPPRLDGSRQKLFEFLSGYLGGPPLYHQNRGHPKLRLRHFPFKINAAARDSWLACMNQALDEQTDNQLLLMQLKSGFYKTADHMINNEAAKADLD